MKSAKVKQGLMTVLFMLATTFVAISGVSLVSLGTRARVERNASLFRKAAILEAAGVTVPDDPVAALDLFEQSVSPVPTAGEPRYYRINTPQHEAMVFFRQGPGLWGTIRAAVGVSTDLDRFTGISFVEQNETPGLGARITEPWFKAQIEGKRAPVALVPEDTASTDPNEIDAITGATVTSKAVRHILNSTMQHARAALQSDTPN